MRQERGFSLLELAAVVSLTAVVLMVAATLSGQLQRGARDIESLSDVERLSNELAPSLRADLDRATRVRLSSASRLELTVDRGPETCAIVYQLDRGSIERIMTTRGGAVTRRRVEGELDGRFALSPPAPGGHPMVRLEVVHPRTGATLLSLHRRIPRGDR